MGDHPLAYEALQRALEKDPGLPGLKQMRVETLSRLHGTDLTRAGEGCRVVDGLLRQAREGEALEVITSLLALGRKEDPALRVRLGRILLHFGRAKAAESHARAAAERDPRSGEAFALLGETLLAQGRAQEAEGAFENARANAPQDPRLLLLQGQALLTLERLGEALALFDEALGLDPGSVEAWQGKGAALDRQGRYAEAAEAYSRATLPPSS